MIAHSHKYCRMLNNDDPLLEEFINHIKNADKYEVIEKEEDGDKDSDLNMNVDDSI